MIANYSIAEKHIAFTKVPKSANNVEKFSFAGFGLDNENVVVTHFDGLHNAGTSDFLDVGNIAGDGGNFLSRHWRKKTFTISGILKSKTTETLGEIIDDFKKSFYQKEGVFRWRYADGKFREICATASVIDFDRKNFHITFVPFTLMMVVNDVYWKEKSNVKTFSESGRFVAEIITEGNVNTEMQIIVIVKSGNMESFSAEKNGKKLAMNTSTKGSVFIDTKKKQVKMDGKIADYSGVHFSLEPGKNEIIFDFTGTFEADIFVKYDTNFL